jgi:hypothetical protein
MLVWIRSATSRASPMKFFWNSSMLGILLADQLDGDDLPEIARAELHGLVDDAHAALGDLADHLVVQLVEDVRRGASVKPFSNNLRKNTHRNSQ